MLGIKRIVCSQRTLLSRVPRLQQRFISEALQKFDKRNPDSYAVYLVTDDKYLDSTLEDKIVNACKGGVTIVQLRLKHVNTGLYVDTARSVRKKLESNGFAHIPLIIDDRLDVCLAADADGLHVGDGDLDCRDARRILGPEKILGLSTYGEVARVKIGKEADVDYVAGGGVVSSTTKSFRPKGIPHLHEFKKVAGDLPAVAIGGVGPSNAFDIAYSGADGLSCVSALLDPEVDQVESVARFLKEAAVRASHMKARTAKFGDAKVTGETTAKAVNELREKKPLVQCMTNYVSMDIMANVLLASGASPVMIHALEEASEFAKIASVVSINPGTLSAPWVESMYQAANVCSQERKPWILDPVGNGATSYRNEVFLNLLQKKPSVVRGNPSEILVSASQLGIDVSNSENKQSGVDSLVDSMAINLDIVDELARKVEGVVVMTGSNDYVTDGKGEKYLVCHDVPELQAITAAGCSLSSLVGAFVALDTNHARACAHACAFYTLAAEQAAKQVRMQAAAAPLVTTGRVGPGQMRVAIMDWLQNIDDETIKALTRIEKL